MDPRQQEEEWQRRATGAAIQAARDLIGDPVKVGKSPVLGSDHYLPAGTPIGRLSDVEWGWLFAAMLAAWICTRAEQATSEGLEVEAALRTTGLDPDPWDSGVIAAILPQLADDPRFDWAKSLKTWSRLEMLGFLGTALNLARKAKAARDLGSGITRKRESHGNDQRSPGDGREDRELPAGTLG
jgi:hypothetical protein